MNNQLTSTENKIRQIDEAIADIEMIQVLQPDTFPSGALDVALQCMRAQRTLLLNRMVEASKTGKK